MEKGKQTDKLPEQVSPNSQVHLQLALPNFVSHKQTRNPKIAKELSVRHHFFADTKN